MNKVLLIGKGYWGKNWYKTLMDCQTQFQVVDVNVNDSVDQNGICYYDSLDKIDKSHFTHAIISTPSETHVQLFNKVKEFIKPEHILIEKPCGSHWIDAEKVSGCFPGYLQLHSPAFNYIHNNIDLIGFPHFYKSIRASMGPRIRNGGTIVEDYLVHDLYLFISLFQPYDDIQIINKTFTNRLKHTGPDSVFVTLYNPEVHVIGDMFSSWWYPIKERRVIITGSKGSFIWLNDDLYFNSSRYEDLDGIDSFGNVGHKLIQSNDEKVDLGKKTSMECELENLLTGKFTGSCLYINAVWNLIRDITQKTRYKF